MMAIKQAGHPGKSEDDGAAGGWAPTNEVGLAPADETLALSILRKMAHDATDWTVDDSTACLEACWFTITNDEADLLRRLDTGARYT